MVFAAYSLSPMRALLIASGLRLVEMVVHDGVDCVTLGIGESRFAYCLQATAILGRIATR
jgi:hypothetical protein